jgi:alkanesulfonate monooxygenase SsuD/methylene tetrahydromethanopterin reductase-like flavin-dependent oxidoreductase (luciferase family)
MVRFGVDLEKIVDYEALTRTVSELERLGFNSVWVEDHLVTSLGSEYLLSHEDVPVSELALPVLECWTTLSWLAAQTRRIRLGTLVLCNLFRPPSVLAKMASTFDVLSNGRLEFGLGGGYWEPEFKMYGIPMPNLRTRMEQLVESIQIIKSMWTQDVTDFEGKHYSVRHALNMPKPVQKPHPPILIGGRSERLMKVAAQLADNWNLPGAVSPTPEEYNQMVSTFDEYCRQASRSPKDVVKSILFQSCIVDKNKDRLKEQVRRLKPEWQSTDAFMKRLIGTPEQCIEKLNSFRDSGVQYFIVAFADATDLGSMQLFAEEIIPAIK